MTFQQPAVLWGLPALVALAFLYLRRIHRRPASGDVIFPQWLVASAAAHARPARRHLPAALFLLALGAAVTGAARPVYPWPTLSGTPVVLVIDVSRSMEENDVLPSRIEATRTAALDFVDGLPRSARVAVVSFGSSVTVVVPLTDDRERQREGIRGVTTQLRTQLGTGLVEAVREVTGESWPSGQNAAPPTAAPSDRPRAIAILLSDGRASDGVPPLEAAEEARRRGVRVHTVGVATTKDPSLLRSGYWGILDDETLQAIADLTGGRYYHAGSMDRLREVYRELARTIGWERRPTEVTALAGAAALVFVVASVLMRYVVYPIH
jgi:Ca-activated chloride channel family protein